MDILDIVRVATDKYLIPIRYDTYKILGWLRHWTFEAGLVEMARWYLEHEGWRRLKQKLTFRSSRPSDMEAGNAPRFPSTKPSSGDSPLARKCGPVQEEGVEHGT